MKLFFFSFHSYSMRHWPVHFFHFFFLVLLFFLSTVAEKKNCNRFFISFISEGKKKKLLLIIKFPWCFITWFFWFDKFFPMEWTVYRNLPTKYGKMNGAANQIRPNHLNDSFKCIKLVKVMLSFQSIQQTN